MNVVIGSAFRNASYYLDRYFQQIDALRQLCPYGFRLIAVEGDSTDNTEQRLRELATRYQLPIQLVTCNHGGPWYGSVESKDRMIALSQVGNAIFESVHWTDDILVYVESDLIWDAHTMKTLIECAARREKGYDIFAPMVFAGRNFYDIWAFRKNGERFIPFPPYHRDLLKKGTHEWTEVDSAGSCLVMRGVVACTARIRDNNCLVGWSEDAREKGFKIATCPDLRIQHP